MPVEHMYMWYVLRVCDDKDMSLNTSLTHMALTTALVDATACAEHQNQNRKRNHPRHRAMDTPGRRERAGMMFLTTPIVFM